MRRHEGISRGTRPSSWASDATILTHRPSRAPDAVGSGTSRRRPHGRRLGAERTAGRPRPPRRRRSRPFRRPPGRPRSRRRRSRPFTRGRADGSAGDPRGGRRSRPFTRGRGARWLSGRVPGGGAGRRRPQDSALGGEPVLDRERVRIECLVVVGRVGTGRAADRRVGRAVLGVDRVVAVAARDRVRTGPAGQEVVPVAAEDPSAPPPPLTVSFPTKPSSESLPAPP